MFSPWTEKYKPSKLSEVVDQGQAVKAVMEWARGWERGKPAKPALLLYGPPGSGKTTIAEALAKEFGWDSIQLNASDKRTFEVLKRVAGEAATTGTLFEGAGGRRLVILDEADNIHSRSDLGGYRAVREVLGRTTNPIILIANDRRAIPSEILNSCLQVNLRRLSPQSIERALERICEMEGIEAEPLALKRIAEASRGDLRAAINDLQTSATGKKRCAIRDLALYLRDMESNVFQVLGGILHASSVGEARRILWSLDMPPDEAIGWISENAPLLAKNPLDRARIYEALSRADIFLSRARRKQVYGLWGYASDLMAAGPSILRDGETVSRRLQVPSSAIAYRQTRGERTFRESVARKVASRCHTSSRVARKHFLKYLGVILKHDRKRGRAIAEELELTEGEAEYLKSVVDL